MPILDDSGQSPSITEGSRALRLFTDRYHPIRLFTRALHEDDALGKILFFQGGGGNGKSLLIRFLQEYACKRFHLWDDLRKQADAEFVRRLQGDRSFDPLPVASLDFHAPPREFEQPMVDYDALLMLRRQLGVFRVAESFARLHFPVYDFAAVWYLHQTGRLTQERLSTLFPNEEINLVVALAQVFREIPGAGVAQAVLGLFNEHLREWWTLFRRRRAVDSRELIEEIQGMDPERDLIPEMPRLFALDLNAALGADGAPPRVALLFDGHDAFATPSGASTPEGDRDRWLRYLLAALDLEGGVVPVVTSRLEPRWPGQAEYSIPSEYLDRIRIGHFSDADADVYLAKAEVDDPVLRARLCDYARVAPDEVHPLYAGLGADVVLQAARRGHRLSVDDFPEEPPAARKRQLLVERLLTEANQDVAYAVQSLAAARAFDREIFETLGRWERSRYSTTDAAFDTLTGFSFVWEAETRGAGWYSVHALLRRILRERGDERLREADAALEAIYRERADTGEPLALAEAIYHAYQQQPERGLNEWFYMFVRAQKVGWYELCEALRTLEVEFQREEMWWRGIIAATEGSYLLDRYRFAEADEALQASIAAYDEVLRRAPDNITAHNYKGLALTRHGDLLANLSHYEEAEQAYAEAMSSFDEALRRGPDYIDAHINMGNTLRSRGDLLAGLARYEEAEQAYADAVISFEEVFRWAPDNIMAYGSRGSTLAIRAELLVKLARYEEAEQVYEAAVASFDEVLHNAPDEIMVHNSRATALQSRGELFARLARYEEAEQAYAEAVGAYDEVLHYAPGNIYALSHKGNTLARRGDLLADLSRYEEAQQAYAEAVASFDEALRHAPDNIMAHNNRATALQSRGALLAKLARYEEAEQVYEAAVASFDEVLHKAPNNVVTHNNRGNVLQSRGELFARLARYEEAEQAYAEAVGAYDEALRHAADYIEAHSNKGSTLARRGELLAKLARYDEAEGAYTDAVAAFDEALSHAPDYIPVHGNKGSVLALRGELLAGLSRYEEAQQSYVDAVAAFDEALRRAPDYIDAHNYKGGTLVRCAELLHGLARYEEAEQAYAAAVAAFDEALRRAPGNITAHTNKGSALAIRGNLLAGLDRHDDAENAFEAAVATLDDVIRYAPDYIEAHSNKALALFRWGLYRRFAKVEGTRALWEMALVHAERVIALAPQLEQGKQLLNVIRHNLDSLDTDSS